MIHFGEVLLFDIFLILFLIGIINFMIILCYMPSHSIYSNNLNKELSIIENIAITLFCFSVISLALLFIIIIIMWVV